MPIWIPSQCWNCGAMHDVAAPLDASKLPKAGDAVLCVGCGEWSVVVETFGGLTAALSAVRPTPNDFVRIGNNRGCRQLRESWLGWRAAGSPKPINGL